MYPRHTSRGWYLRSEPMIPPMRTGLTGNARLTWTAEHGGWWPQKPLVPCCEFTWKPTKKIVSKLMQIGQRVGILNHLDPYLSFEIWHWPIVHQTCQWCQKHLATDFGDLRILVASKEHLFGANSLETEQYQKPSALLGHGLAPKITHAKPITWFAFCYPT